MNMKADVNTETNRGEAVETAGDATIISWSLFASLDELRHAPEAAEPAVHHAPAEAGLAAGQGKGGNLQSALGQYTEWLRTFNR
jgi:hypothetical protein